MSLAAVDWIMSLDPHWYSTIYGLIHGRRPGAVGAVVRGGGAGAPRAARADEPRAAAGHFHDLGKLMLALRDALGLLLVLAVPDHLGRQPARRDSVLPGAAARRLGATSACCSSFGHFVLPFCLLLSRDLKRRPHLLARVAWFIVAIRLVRPDLAGRADLQSQTGGFMPISLANIGMPLVLGGVWLFLFAQQLRQAAAAAGERSVLQAHAPARA